MADKKTTTIMARIDTASRTHFRKMAGAHGLSESELLRSLVLRQIGAGGFIESPVVPDPKESDLAPMTVRMPRFLMKAAKDRPKPKGWRQVDLQHFVSSVIELEAGLVIRGNKGASPLS
jgi:hypothetical protein